VGSGIKKVATSDTTKDILFGDKEDKDSRGILGGLLTSRVALPLASGLLAGAFTKDKEDPIYTGQDVGLNLQDIAKLANISDPKTASAIGLRFSPDVASRKFTPEEMAATYAANRNEILQNKENKPKTVVSWVIKKTLKNFYKI
jgi:hypothetical protein